MMPRKLTEGCGQIVRHPNRCAYSVPIKRLPQITNPFAETGLASVMLPQNEEGVGHTR
jgi:hypothetical protein